MTTNAALAESAAAVNIKRSDGREVVGSKASLSRKEDLASNVTAAAPLASSSQTSSLSVDQHEHEREKILSNLIEAVEQCQNTFGGKSQLAADTDTVVSVLLLRLERVFQHGLRQTLAKSVIDGAFKQFTEISGLNFNHIKPEMGSDVVFWSFVKLFLSKDELIRFNALCNVTTDFARGRAWIRAALNEHNLSKYISMINVDPNITKQFYDPHAFLLDGEKMATLPDVIGNLHKIYFALKIDNADLELGRSMTCDSSYSNAAIDSATPLDPFGDIVAPIPIRQEALLLKSNSSSSSDKKRRRHKKKKLAKIEESSRNNQSTSSPFDNFTQGNVYNRSEDVFAHLESMQNCSTTGAAPDLIPIFEKLDINYPLFKQGLLSSHNSEGSTQDGSFATRASESFDLFEESGEHVNYSMNELGGGEQKRDTLVKEASYSNHPMRRVGHYRSQSDNANKLNFIEDGVNDYMPISSVRDNKMELAHATLNAGGSSSHSGSPSSGGLSVSDMKQAVLDMMKQKDFFERQNNQLQESLRVEREQREAAEKSLDETKAELEVVRRESEEKENTLKREVNLLKGQLKRYISAVNTLKEDRQTLVNYNATKSTSSIGTPTKATPTLLSYSQSPPNGKKSEWPECDNELDSSPLDGIEDFRSVSVRSEDDSAAAYESKLIAMSGLHAELIELNDQLQNDILAKERTIHHLRNEVNILRGPLPGNEFLTVEDLAAMFVNIWIPSSFLRQSHHIYQVSIRIKDEEWRIYKRYQQFYDFHNSIKKEYPTVDTFEFPQKKTVGNKDAKFIEERKRGLQIYLQKTTNFLVKQHSRIRTQLSKDVLINFLPFFSPVHNAFTVNR